MKIGPLGIPPSYYMWSYSLKTWVVMREEDVEFAHELGFFVLWWPKSDSKPTKWVYNRIFHKAFHEYADMGRDIKGLH